MVKSFSQKFVIYHGCGAWYHDGTKKILSKNRRCIRPTYETFWKKPNDVRNKVEARAQLKLKSIVKVDYIKRYMNFIGAFERKPYLTSDDESTDDESANNDLIDDKSYNRSKTGNNFSISNKQSNTGENPVIDESIDSNIKPTKMKQRIDSYPLPFHCKIL